MKIKTLYLAESYYADISGDDSLIVCLTPQACWQFEQNNISYKIPQDFLPEHELRKDESLFYQEQRSWFDDLDLCLQKEIPLCSGYRLVRIHANRLKYLMDDFIIRSRQLHAVLKAVQPSEVLYVRSGERRTEGDYSLYNLRRWDRHSFEPILENFALSQPRAFKWSWLASQPHSSSEIFFQSQAINFLKLGGFKKWVPRHLGKWIQDVFRYRKLTFDSNLDSPKKILFLDSGTWVIDDLIRQFLLLSCEIMIKSDCEIRSLNSQVSQTLIARSSINSPDGTGTELFLKAYRKIKSNGFLDWIDRWAPFSIKSLLEPYWEHFFTKELPQVFAQSLELKKFLAEQNVDAVISRATVGKNYPSALLAAENLGIPRICFQHSVGPLDIEDWVDDELYFVDRNFAISTPSKDYFQSKTQNSDYQHCDVFEYSRYLFRFNELFEREKKKHFLQKPPGKPILLYVPSKLAHGLTHFNTPFYPISWYFEHQKKILRFLNSQNGYTIIYKHTPGQEWADQCILPFIQKEKLVNIQVRKGFFSEYVSLSSKVLFDFPSTGVFEASASKVPFLALIHNSMKLWPPMKSIFGQCFHFFSRTEDALEGIGDFLESSESDYLIKLPMETPPASEALLQTVIERVHKRRTNV